MISGTQLEELAFVGETLGPLFLYEPNDERVRPLYEAFAAMDVAEAASEWPFAGEEAARSALSLMKEGATAWLSAPSNLASTAAAAPASVAAPAPAPTTTDLLSDYRRLFVGPGKKVAPPWGSVYTDREQAIFGASTLALREWMRQAGVERQLDERDPEDHIGLMLLLLAWTSQSEPEIVDEYLSQHLLTWAPHFLEIVAAEAEDAFLKGLAQLTLATFKGIQSALNLQVEIPRFYR